jgi:hypothetical protein
LIGRVFAVIVASDAIILGTPGFWLVIVPMNVA